MKTFNRIYLAAAVATLGFAAASCNDIVDDATIDWEQWKADAEARVDKPVYTTYTLSHPCLLHSQADFDYVRQHLGEEPYASAFAKLTSNTLWAGGYTPTTVKYLARLDANNWAQMGGRWEDAGIADLWYSGIHTNYTNLMRDAAAAYQMALVYRLNGNTDLADAAKNILVRWSIDNDGFLRNSRGELLDPNQILILFQPYQMAAAAEMLRDYGGWGSTDEFAAVVSWMKSVFYPVAHDHLQTQNNTGGGHYWLNWDLCSLATILSIGILADDQDYINEAIMYFKGDGSGPGNIYKGVPFLHDDPDSSEKLGQGNECGRDQGHNTLCAAVLALFCKMGQTIGDDLFAFADNRAIAFAEYVAKYNLAKSMLYPDPMANFPTMAVGSGDSDFEFPHASFPFSSYTYGDAGTMTQPSNDGRGTVRPGWDYYVGYANTHGLSAIYCSQFGERMRPDGGGGHYSANSGGYDQLGLSTLMGYRPAE